MAKPKVNYWVDVVIGAAFIVSALSGLVFLLPVSQGSLRVLGVSYRAWDTMHLWGSLAMIAGVLTHLVLHSKWIVCMTQRAFGLDKRRSARETAACPVPATASVVSRRRFLTIGAGTLAVGALLAGGNAVLGAVARVLESVAGEEGVDASTAKPRKATDKGMVSEDATSVEADVPEVDTAEPVATNEATEPASAGDGASLEETTPTPEPTVEAAVDPTATPVPAVTSCVACPRGLVNDPYPGRCRLYVDSDKDGLCDHSIPTPCG